MKSKQAIKRFNTATLQQSLIGFRWFAHFSVKIDFHRLILLFATPNKAVLRAEQWQRWANNGKSLCKQNRKPQHLGSSGRLQSIARGFYLISVYLFLGQYLIFFTRLKMRKEDSAAFTSIARSHFVLWNESLSYWGRGRSSESAAFSESTHWKFIKKTSSPPTVLDVTYPPNTEALNK